MLTTMKTVPSNMLTVGKPVNQGHKQQTIIINKPPGLRMPSGQQYIVVTSGSPIRPVQTITTTQNSEKGLVKYMFRVASYFALCMLLGT